MRRTRAVIGILLICAAALRIAAFRQLDRTPLLRMDRWAQSDMHYFEAWGREISRGDWRAAAVPIPMHRWHHEVAQRYLSDHPDAAVRLSGGADSDETIWKRWMHAPRFYQDPLYAYFVAAVYSIAVPDPRYAIACQLVLGIGSVFLIWALARRYFGDAVAACAGALAVLCAPLLFYELLLLRDSLVAFAGLVLVWVADRAIARDRRAGFLILGAAAGVACVLKSTFFLFAIAFLLTFAVLRHRERRAWGAAAGAMACGFAIAMAPLVARNVAVGAPALSMAASGPMTFVAANEARAEPDRGFGIDVPLLTSFLGDTDGGWRAAVRVVGAGQTAGGFSALLWRKWDRAWHWFEIPNNENLYYMRERAGVLSWMPITFFIIAPLALAGLAIGARRFRDAWPLYLLVATTVGSLLGFYVLGRFRVALIAAVIPFAALTLVEIWRWIRAGRFLAAGTTAAAVVLLGAWTGRPLADGQVLIRTADWILPYSVFYQDQVYGALDRKDWNAAASWYLDFFRYEPSDAEILQSSDRTLAPELADMHRECAQILRAAGRETEAAQQIEAAQRILALRPVH